jgi:hypothetical protein
MGTWLSGGIAISFMSSALDGGEWSASRFIPGGKRLRYPVDRKLSGPQGRFGSCEEEKKNLFFLSRIESRPSNPLLRYNDEWCDDQWMMTCSIIEGCGRGLIEIVSDISHGGRSDRLYGVPAGIGTQGSPVMTIMVTTHSNTMSIYSIL